MSDLDDRIRVALSGLREAPTPPLPQLRPARAERPNPGPVLAAAAAMLLLLTAALTFVPSRPSAAEAALSARIASLESRITKIEHDELRSLLGRELALLRRELELSQAR